MSGKTMRVAVGYNAGLIVTAIGDDGLTAGSACLMSIADEQWVDGEHTLRPFDDDMFLFRLFVSPQSRRRGVATAIVRQCIADHGQRLVLQPSAFADSPLSTDELRAWYERLGFVPHESEHRWMRYQGGDDE